MEEFTGQELVDMIFIYGFCDGNAAAAEREYGRRFPNRRLPSRRTFPTVFRNLAATATFRKAPGQGRPRINREAEVLDAIEQDPTTSIRNISRQINVPRPTVLHILKISLTELIRCATNISGWKNIKATRSTCLSLSTCTWLDTRRFCATYAILSLDNEQASKILWCDEATFTRNGKLNFHNSHYWEEENPHVVRRTNFQQRFSINLWAGIIHDTLIGPIEIPQRLNSNLYLNLLQENLPQILDDLPLNLRRNMFFQHDGAPAHSGRNVLNFLNENFAGRWIGRHGPVAWPPRSPDLTPLDFFFWGYLNQKVYATEVDTREELLQRINDAANEIRQNRFSILIASRSVTRRARLCIREGGGFFEQFLK